MTVHDVAAILMNPTQVGSQVYLMIEWYDTQVYPLRAGTKFVLSLVLSALLPVVGHALLVLNGEAHLSLDAITSAAGMGFTAASTIHRLFEGKPLLSGRLLQKLADRHAANATASSSADPIAEPPKQN